MPAHFDIDNEKFWDWVLEVEKAVRMKKKKPHRPRSGC